MLTLYQYQLAYRETLFPRHDYILGFRVARVLGPDELGEDVVSIATNCSPVDLLEFLNGTAEQINEIVMYIIRNRLFTYSYIFKVTFFFKLFHYQLFK